ncbi:MAG: hypothetical protein KAT30_02930 [Candidatus Krumholzibacteria bacterium]|nr:hypothetical protein [Candidatus Krumholzibacteria bacterium]
MTRVIKVALWLAALTIATASPAWAGLTTAHLATDAEMLAMLSDTLFVGEGRIGDGWGAATFEIDLGGDTGNPSTTAQYGWTNGTSVPWTLAYDHLTDEISFTVDGVRLYYTTPLSGFSNIFVRTRAVNSGTDIVVDNLVLDAEAVGDVSGADGDVTGLDILWISGETLANGFTLTGNTTMSWTGDPPNQSRLAFQIKVGTLNTVKLARVTWGQFKSMFND